MYNVLTAIKNNMLLQELKRLHIWGASTGFEICEVTSDFATLTEHLRKNRYQLVLLEATPDYPVLNLLQTIRQEKLCQAIAMVGQTAEFKIVRKSFLLGVDDYLRSVSLSRCLARSNMRSMERLRQKTARKNPCLTASGRLIFP